MDDDWEVLSIPNHRIMEVYYGLYYGLLLGNPI